MINRNTWRRALPAAAATAALALAGGLGIDSTAASAETIGVQHAQSENWAGYVAQSTIKFSSVSGSWTEPSVSDVSGDGYSAFWVGLGGSRQQSQSLEQVGTSADVVNGRTQYYAWYELLPAAETRLKLDIEPGDHISARVTVDGTNVTVSLSDDTTGQSVAKTLQMSNPDTSSAEWIAEAPATASQYGADEVLPLADFGTVTFTDASATAAGHTGTIADPGWAIQQLQLATSTGSLADDGAVLSELGLGQDAEPSAGASPSRLSSAGSSFSVSYDAGASSQSSADGTPGFSTGGHGYEGYGYGGYGLGDGDGYGYGGGYSLGGYGYPGYGYGYGHGYSSGYGGGYALGGGYTYATPSGYSASF
jgi:hypothetical protein